MTLRVAFAGTPDFAVPALRALHAAHTVVGVWTQPDRPSGRGRALAASPVKQAAQELGLSVAHRIITDHGGNIWAENEPGCGSKFIFVLPP